MACKPCSIPIKFVLNFYDLQSYFITQVTKLLSDLFEEMLLGPIDSYDTADVCFIRLSLR